MRRYLRLLLIGLALVGAVLIGIGVPVFSRGCAPVPPPIAIAPAPPSVTLVPPTLTPAPPTATSTATATWVFVPPTFTPITATQTPWVPTFTPTVAPTRTPTMWDTDTRGDTPVPPVVVKPPLAPNAGGDPGEGLDIISGLIGLLIVAVAGGLVSQGLEMWSRWRNWKPDPRAKMVVVLGLTSLVGGGLTWIQTYALPQYWQFLPVSVRAFIVAVALFGISQAYHNNKPAKAPEPEEQIPVATRART